jgi:hypothetical protein
MLSVLTSIAFLTHRITILLLLIFLLKLDGLIMCPCARVLTLCA